MPHFRNNATENLKPPPGKVNLGDRAEEAIRGVREDEE